MFNETKINQSAELQSDLALQTEALKNKFQDSRVKRRFRLQKELESQTGALEKILIEITLLNNHLEKIETTLCSMQKTKTTPKNHLNILDKFDFDADKLLDTVKVVFDLYKEDLNVNNNNNNNNNEEATEDKEVLNRILKEITILNKKTNINPLPHMGQPFQNPLNILNNFDFEKILNIVSLVSHLYKNMNEDEVENDDMKKGTS